MDYCVTELDPNCDYAAVDAKYDSRGRRSSILKPPKARVPLVEVDFGCHDDLDDLTDVSRKRRVSFAGINKIKEFNINAESFQVLHTPAYEEMFSLSSDSSAMTSSVGNENVPVHQLQMKESCTVVAAFESIEASENVCNDSMDLTNPLSDAEIQVEENPLPVRNMNGVSTLQRSEMDITECERPFQPGFIGEIGRHPTASHLQEKSVPCKNVMIQHDSTYSQTVEVSGVAPLCTTNVTIENHLQLAVHNGSSNCLGLQKSNCQYENSVLMDITEAVTRNNVYTSVQMEMTKSRGHHTNFTDAKTKSENRKTNSTIIFNPHTTKYDDELNGTMEFTETWRADAANHPLDYASRQNPKLDFNAELKQMPLNSLLGFGNPKGSLGKLGNTFCPTQNRQQEMLNWHNFNQSNLMLRPAKLDCAVENIENDGSNLTQCNFINMDVTAGVGCFSTNNTYTNVNKKLDSNINSNPFCISGMNAELPNSSGYTDMEFTMTTKLPQGKSCPTVHNTRESVVNVNKTDRMDITLFDSEMVTNVKPRVSVVPSAHTKYKVSGTNTIFPLSDQDKTWDRKLGQKNVKNVSVIQNSSSRLDGCDGRDTAGPELSPKTNAFISGFPIVDPWHKNVGKVKNKMCQESLMDMEITMSEPVLIPTINQQNKTDCSDIMDLTTAACDYSMQGQQVNRCSPLGSQLQMKGLTEPVDNIYCGLKPNVESAPKYDSLSGTNSQKTTNSSDYMDFTSLCNFMTIGEGNKSDKTLIASHPETKNCLVPMDKLTHTTYSNVIAVGGNQPSEVNSPEEDDCNMDLTSLVNNYTITDQQSMNKGSTESENINPRISNNLAHKANSNIVPKTSGSYLLKTDECSDMDLTSLENRNTTKNLHSHLNKELLEFRNSTKDLPKCLEQLSCSTNLKTVTTGKGDKLSGVNLLKTCEQSENMDLTSLENDCSEMDQQKNMSKTLTESHCAFTELPKSLEKSYNSRYVNSANSTNKISGTDFQKASDSFRNMDLTGSVRNNTTNVQYNNINKTIMESPIEVSPNSTLVQRSHSKNAESVTTNNGNNLPGINSKKSAELSGNMNGHHNNMNKPIVESQCDSEDARSHSTIADSVGANKTEISGANLRKPNGSSIHMDLTSLVYNNTLNVHHDRTLIGSQCATEASSKTLDERSHLKNSDPVIANNMSKISGPNLPRYSDHSGKMELTSLACNDTTEVHHNNTDKAFIQSEFVTEELPAALNKQFHTENAESSNGSNISCVNLQKPNESSDNMDSTSLVYNNTMKAHHNNTHKTIEFQYTTEALPEALEILTCHSTNNVPFITNTDDTICGVNSATSSDHSGNIVAGLLVCNNTVKVQKEYPNKIFMEFQCATDGLSATIEEQSHLTNMNSHIGSNDNIISGVNPQKTSEFSYPMDMTSLVCNKSLKVHHINTNKTLIESHGPVEVVPEFLDIESCSRNADSDTSINDNKISSEQPGDMDLTSLVCHDTMDVQHNNTYKPLIESQCAVEASLVTLDKQSLSTNTNALIPSHDSKVSGLNVQKTSESSIDMDTTSLFCNDGIKVNRVNTNKALIEIHCSVDVMPESLKKISHTANANFDTASINNKISGDNLQISDEPSGNMDLTSLVCPHALNVQYNNTNKTFIESQCATEPLSETLNRQSLSTNIDSVTPSHDSKVTGINLQKTNNSSSNMDITSLVSNNNMIVHQINANKTLIKSHCTVDVTHESLDKSSHSTNANSVATNDNNKVSGVNLQTSNEPSGNMDLTSLVCHETLNVQCDKTNETLTVAKALSKTLDKQTVPTITGSPDCDNKVSDVNLQKTNDCSSTMDLTTLDCKNTTKVHRINMNKTLMKSHCTVDGIPESLDTLPHSVNADSANKVFDDNLQKSVESFSNMDMTSLACVNTMKVHHNNTNIMSIKSDCPRDVLPECFDNLPHSTNSPSGTVDTDYEPRGINLPKTAEESNNMDLTGIGDNRTVKDHEMTSSKMIETQCVSKGTPESLDMFSSITNSNVESISSCSKISNLTKPNEFSGGTDLTSLESDYGQSKLLIKQLNRIETTECINLPELVFAGSASLGDTSFSLKQTKAVNDLNYEEHCIGSGINSLQSQCAEMSKSLNKFPEMPNNNVKKNMPELDSEVLCPKVLNLGHEQEQDVVSFKQGRHSDGDIHGKEDQVSVDHRISKQVSCETTGDVLVLNSESGCKQDDHKLELELPVRAGMTAVIFQNDSSVGRDSGASDYNLSPTDDVRISPERKTGDLKVDTINKKSYNSENSPELENRPGADSFGSITYRKRKHEAQFTISPDTPGSHYNDDESVSKFLCTEAGRVAELQFAPGLNKVHLHRETPQYSLGKDKDDSVFEANCVYMSKLGFTHYNGSSWKHNFLFSSFCLVLDLPSGLYNSGTHINEIYFEKNKQTTDGLLIFFSKLLMEKYGRMLKFKYKLLQDMKHLVDSVKKGIASTKAFRETVDYFRKRYPVSIRDKNLDFVIVSLKDRIKFDITIDMRSWCNLGGKSLTVSQKFGKIDEMMVRTAFSRLPPEKERLYHFVNYLIEFCGKMKVEK